MLTDFLNLNNLPFLMCLVVSVINGVLLVLLARKFLQILQLSGYKIRGYFVWLKDTKAKYISRIALLCSLSLCCVLVIDFLFGGYHPDRLFSYIGLLFYIYFSIVLVVNVNKTPQKTPLVQTRRMSRLMTLLFLLGAGITFVAIWLCSVWVPFLAFNVAVLIPMFLPLLVPVVHFILLPLEAFIRWTYIEAAKQKLKKYPDLIKIGITGSYGKTSVKHILNVMLSQKYNVCMSPHSFNTPMGLTKVVLKYLKKENQVLIAEMGAKQVGDIKYLCNLIEPQHAILTGVGSQHYQTFGSAENISKTKYELIQSLPENAVAVFNIDNKPSKRLFKQCELKNKVGASYHNQAELKIDNVKLSPNGSEFNLVYGDESVKCKTKLLGKHNILNILMSATLALKLGVTLKQIAKAVGEVEPMNHRLEPINKGDLVILDDAYSSNEEGAKMALDVLDLYKDYNKICITPGIVELGEQEYKTNVLFGEKMAKICNSVIIVNKVNAEAIKQGLENGNFNQENILQVETLQDSNAKLSEILQKNQKNVVLYMNDLPDNYT